MKRKNPDEKTVLGKRCYSRAKTSREIGCALSTLDDIIRMSRTNKAKVPIRFFQLKRGGDIWFPVDWLHEWMELVGDSGCAI